MISQIKSKNILSLNNLSNIEGGTLSAIFNTESVWHFLYNKDYREYIYSCQNLAIDGIGLKLALGFKGHYVDRFHGPDLCSELINNRLKYDASILVLGGQEQNFDLLRDKKIDGFLPLPIMNNISDFERSYANLSKFICIYNGKKIIMVSLGLPKQEMFCQWLFRKFELDPLINEKEVILFPVGAAIDFLSGYKVRSSIFWQKHGLEWLPRLVREPRMLIRVFRSIASIFFLICEHFFSKHK